MKAEPPPQGPERGAEQAAVAQQRATALVALTRTSGVSSRRFLKAVIKQVLLDDVWQPIGYNGPD